MAYIPPSRRGKGGETGGGSQGVIGAKGRSLSDLAGDSGRGGLRGARDRRIGGGGGTMKHSFFKPESERPTGTWMPPPPGGGGGGKGEGARFPPAPSGGNNFGGGGGGGGGGRKRQSAPKAFGTNDHGAGLKAEEDLPEGGGVRVDEEGMVYDCLQQRAAGGTTPPNANLGCVYFCDRFRRYRFETRAGGLGLLRGLVAANRRLLARNDELFAALPGKPSAEEVAKLKAEGYALYEEKPTLQKNHTGTWSDEEYSLPGFQWMYLRYKSFQRFAETWALLERCAVGGLFSPRCGILAAPPRRPTTPLGEEDGAPSFSSSSEPPLRVVSLGGGPGYELLAFDWFARMMDATAPRAWQPSADPSPPPSATTAAGGKASWADVEEEEEEARVAEAAEALGGLPSLAVREEWLSARFRDVEAEVAAGAGMQASTTSGDDGMNSAVKRRIKNLQRPGLLRGNDGDDADNQQDAAATTTTTRGGGVVRPRMDLASLDLQASWDVYVHEMGYDFHQWDMHESEAGSVASGPRSGPTAAATTAEVAVGVVLGAAGSTGGTLGEPIEAALAAALRAAAGEADAAEEEGAGAGAPPRGNVVCMLSNILCYCTDEETAEYFLRLLSPPAPHLPPRVRAILVNERGAEQRIVEKLQRRGVVVVRLLDQRPQGRDDRQMVFLPPGSKLATDHGDGNGPTLPNTPLSARAFRDMTFPNQPYEEKKYRRAKGH